MVPARWLFGNIYAVANSGFYYMIAVILALNFAIIYASTRARLLGDLAPTRSSTTTGP